MKWLDPGLGDDAELRRGSGRSVGNDALVV